MDDILPKFDDMDDVKAITRLGGIAGLILFVLNLLPVIAYYNLEIDPQTAQFIELEDKIPALSIAAGILLLVLIASWRTWVGKGYVSATALLVFLGYDAYVRFSLGFPGILYIGMLAFMVVALVFSLKAILAARRIKRAPNVDGVF